MPKPFLRLLRLFAARFRKKSGPQKGARGAKRGNASAGACQRLFSLRLGGFARDSRIEAISRQAAKKGKMRKPSLRFFAPFRGQIQSPSAAENAASS
jgi:hypothetical protein